MEQNIKGLLFKQLIINKITSDLSEKILQKEAADAVNAMPMIINNLRYWAKEGGFNS